MRLSVLISVFAAVCLTTPCNAYNILGVFPTPWKSHYFAGGALMRGLAAAGHNVSVISPFPSAKPLQNFQDIKVLGIEELVKEKYPEPVTPIENPLQAMSLFLDLSLLITNHTLTHPVMVELMSSSDTHFDVIIVEAIMKDALLGLGQHFNAPVIGFSPLGASTGVASLVGCPVPVSYIPNLLLNLTDRMTFFERLLNGIVSIFDVGFGMLHDKYQEDIYNAVFTRSDKPSYAEVLKNVSFVLLNQHFSTSYPRPYVPNMVEVGGIQINREEPKQLPEDIREFVEGAEHGVIYLSLGTNIPSSSLPAEVRDGMLRSLSKLRERVLWKWDAQLPGKPDNVMIKKWFPQDDVLGHPNVKLFITHGGLLSLSETVYHGLPIIGIPFFADQMMNMARAVVQGYGLTVEYKNLTEASLTWALNEVLINPKYAEKAKELSFRYRDQPMKPLELAKYWVEYVARHKGAPHIQSAGLSLSAVQYHSLDVIAFVIGVLSLVVYLIWIAIVALCCRHKSKKSNNHLKFKKSN